jgi:hypothetical protein
VHKEPSLEQDVQGSIEIALHRLIASAATQETVYRVLAVPALSALGLLQEFCLLLSEAIKYRLQLGLSSIALAVELALALKAPQHLLDLRNLDRVEEVIDFFSGSWLRLILWLLSGIRLRRIVLLLRGIIWLFYLHLIIRALLLLDI